MDAESVRLGIYFIGVIVGWFVLVALATRLLGRATGLEIFLPGKDCFSDYGRYSPTVFLGTTIPTIIVIAWVVFWAFTH